MGNIFEVLDFSKLLIVLLITILPSVLLLSLILYSDRKSREPLSMILICILSGAFTICFSLIIDKLILTLNLIDASMFPSQNSYSVYRIMVLAGVEEYAKLLILHLFLYKNKAYDDIYDGFVYSSIIALSFSLIETVMYVFREPTFSEMTSLAILRNFTSIPLHIVCGVVMGYFISLQKFSKTRGRKFLNLLLSLFVPTLIHTIYNVFFSIILMDPTSVFTLIIVILFILSIYFIGIMVILKTNRLNMIFINNGYYNKHYRFLMRKSDYIYENLRRST
ncbi:MAG: PrsW family intramembrane metalloprotease [Bacilli bacterium]|nr:PrsW family intramembrane metalloprotease [Bacilli bacterium]